jgi:uncharacterized membrane protein YhaH (DUF805 family)
LSGWWLIILYLPFMALVTLAFLILFGVIYIDMKIYMGLLLLSLAISLVFIFLFAKRGVIGPNKYGEDPKNQQLAIEDHLLD